MISLTFPHSRGFACCSVLVSDQASFITGTILPVDGGKTPQMYVPGFDITNLDNVDVNK